MIVCDKPVAYTGQRCVRPVGHEGLCRTTYTWRGKMKDPK